MDGAGKTGAEEAPSPKGKGERDHCLQEEATAGAPQGPFRGGKSAQPEQEGEGRLSKEWEDAKRRSAMDQLDKELTAERRPQGEAAAEDPDRAMKLSFRARGYDFSGPGLQLPRGWRPSSREDSVEAGLPLPVRGYPEEKKEEEGSANRRPEVGMGGGSRPWARPREHGPSWGSAATRHVAPAPLRGHCPPWSLGLEGALRQGALGKLGRDRGKGVSVRGASEPQLMEGGTQESWRTGDRSWRAGESSLFPEVLGRDFVLKAIGSLCRLGSRTRE